MSYRLGTVLAIAAMLAAGCGEDESSKAAAKEPPLASAAALEQDPFALSCGHVTDQLDGSRAGGRPQHEPDRDGDQPVPALKVAGPAVIAAGPRTPLQHLE